MFNNPYFYQDQPLLIEQVKQCLIELQKQGKRLDDMDVVVNELKEFLTHYDTIITEKVKQFIDEMYTSGELGNIVKDAMKEYLNSITYSKTNEIVLARRRRYIHEFRYTKATNNNRFQPYFMQGCCVYDFDGRRSMVGCFNGMINSAEIEKSNDVKLMNWGEFNKNNTLTQSENTYTMGHANGMTFNETDKKLYIVGSKYYNTEGVYVNDPNIYRINPDFTGYEAKKLLKFHTTDIAYYKGKLYIIDDSTNWYAQKVYTIDWETGATEYVCTIEPKTNSNIYNWDIANDKIFMVSTASKDLSVYDLHTGEFLWNYKIPQFDHTHSWRIAEIEGISVFDDGKVYIMTHRYNGFLSQTQTMMSEVFEGDYIDNALQTYDWELPVINPTAGNYIECNPNIIVDNPNGRGSTPFQDLNEAIDYIHYHPYLDHCRIGLTGDHKLGIFNATSKRVDIIGKEVGESTQRIIGGGFLQGWNGLAFQQIDFYPSSNDPHQTWRGKRATLGMYMANVQFYYCTIWKTIPETNPYYYNADTCINTEGWVNIYKGYKSDIGDVAKGEIQMGTASTAIFEANEAQYKPT